MGGLTERQHWLSVTDDPDYKRQHIFDPNISLEKTLKAITRNFPKDPKGILEIGCGFGRLTKEIKKLYPNAAVCGIDVNPVLIEEAQAESNDIYYYCQDYISNQEDLDVVFSVCVFQHLPTEEKVAYIRQAYAALKRGGQFILQYVEGNHDVFVNHTCSLLDMQHWFEEAGFRISHISYGTVHQDWSWITGVKR